MECFFIRMFALFYNFDNSFVPPGEKGKTLLSLFPFLESITSAVATDWELTRVALVAERKTIPSRRSVYLVFVNSSTIASCNDILRWVIIRKQDFDVHCNSLYRTEICKS